MAVRDKAFVGSVGPQVSSITNGVHVEAVEHTDELEVAVTIEAAAKAAAADRRTILNECGGNEGIVDNEGQLRASGSN